MSIDEVKDLFREHGLVAIYDESEIGFDICENTPLGSVMATLPPNPTMERCMSLINELNG